MDISKSYWLEQYTALQEAWEEMVADNMNRKFIRSMGYGPIRFAEKLG